MFVPIITDCSLSMPIPVPPPSLKAPTMKLDDINKAAELADQYKAAKGILDHVTSQLRYARANSIRLNVMGEDEFGAKSFSIDPVKAKSVLQQIVNDMANDLTALGVEVPKP